MNSCGNFSGFAAKQKRTSYRFFGIGVLFNKKDNIKL